MTIKHAVFDWDGTLADTYPVTNAAYAHTFEKLGMKEQTISFSEVKRITSTMQNKDVLSCIFGNKKDEARKYFYEYIGANHSDKLETIKGAFAVLEYCHQHGIQCYLISNKTNKRIEEQGREPYLTQELNKFGMIHYFDKIVGAGEYEQDKPHFSTCHAIFDGKIPNPLEIIVIGDGEADVKVADAYAQNGQSAISINYDPQNTYKGKEPNYRIGELRYIPAIIEKENNKQAQKARLQFSQIKAPTR